MVTFVGSGKGSVESSRVLTVEWATGDLREECRFLLNTQLLFFKMEKEPTTKMCDDHEWIRSLTGVEANHR